MSSRILTRRQMLVRGASAFGTLILAGCDRLTNAPTFMDVLGSAETLTYRSQRLVLGRHRLAREFTEADLSPVFRSNGTSEPDNPTYRKLRESDRQTSRESSRSDTPLRSQTSRYRRAALSE